MPLHMRLPEARGLQEPVPGRVPGRQPGQLAALFPEGGDGHRRRPGRQGRRPQGPAGQGARQRRDHRGPQVDARTRSPAPPRSKITAAGGRSPSSDAARARREAAPRPGRPATSTGCHPSGRRTRRAPASGVRTRGTVSVQEAAPCSAHSLRRSGRPTCARRCCSRWPSSRSSGSARVIPTPGVDYDAIQSCIDRGRRTTALYGLINLFTGGALLQLSIFALGIMPYITASIIMQLLTVVIPRLEALQKEGQSGQAKITQYTRYLTIGLAVLQSTGLVALARDPGQLFQRLQRATSSPTSRISRSSSRWSSP